MTNTYDICTRCGCEKPTYASVCVICGGSEFVVREYPRYTYLSGMKDVREVIGDYVRGRIKQADAVIVTDIECMCGKPHYMVFPAIASGEYGTRLTLFPRCPIEVHSLSMVPGTLEELLGDLALK